MKTKLQLFFAALGALGGSPGMAQYINTPSTPTQTSPYLYPASTTSTNLEYYNNYAYAVGNSNYALSIVSQAGSGGASSGIYNFTNNNTGGMTLANSAGSTYAQVINVQALGGGSTSGNGGSAGGVTTYNFGSITATGNFAGGLAMFSSQSVGGSGSGSDGQGGGAAGTVTVNNSGALTAGSGSSPLQNGNAFRAIDAFSAGGNAGQGEDGYDGSSASNVNVTNNGNITVYNHATNTSGTNEIYGILLRSYGGQGGAVGSDADTGKDGGDGGIAAEVNITQQNSTINLAGDQNTSSQLVTGAAMGALSIGGNGGTAGNGDTGNPSYAGTGGYSTGGTSSTVALTNSNVQVTGDYLGGILLKNVGGNGGNGGVNDDHSYAGSGGTSGNAIVTFTNSTGNTYQITTQGKNAGAIEAGNVGGTGGYTNDYTPDTGGVVGWGGGGAGAGWTEITLGGPLKVTTNGDKSIGILGYSIGGNGGNAGDLSAVGSTGTAGVGGAGGVAGFVNVSLNGVTLSTSGTQSHGIVAMSVAGSGGNGGDFKGLFDGDAGNGGNGGSSNYIQVTVDSASAITTTGDESAGIIALSLSGSGGAGGARIQGEGSDGAGGTGGSTGTITVDNYGTISTQGLSSYGIYAQGSSGAGGASGYTSSIFYSSNQSGGSSGSVGAINLTNTGSITTQGKGAYGIFGMSLSGGGGAGGASYNLAGALGGDGGLAANAGTLGLTYSGNTITYGDLTHAILLQSIGGGGGDGGSSDGVVAIGGSGEGGGSGGTVTATLSSGSITTYGSQSHALIAQSIGGGGGNAGNATSTSAAGSLAVGGTGGTGGSGNTVSVTSGAYISTLSTKSIGIVAQSVGGGGGNGGAGYALDVGLELSAAVAVGGSGGSGGNGNNVTVTTTGGTIFTGQFATPDTPSNTLPVDAFGILAQSIGGGGGNGGSAWAEAVAIGVPTPDGNEYTASLAYAQGGSGGVAGYASGAIENGVQSGSGVLMTLGNGTQVITQGQGSHGVLAQAVGGGGGNGGDSSATAATLEYTRVSAVIGKINNSGTYDNTGGDNENNDSTSTYSVTAAVSLGGKGGAGGNGGLVTITLGDSGTVADGVTTYGDYANALVAQSIGGGGGNAGVGSGNTASFGASAGASTTLVLGANGGGGGIGGAASAVLDANGTALTYGSGSTGVVVQSIGGGGGTSQGGMISLSGEFTQQIINGDNPPQINSIEPKGVLNIGLGIQGGSGGQGAAATATINGKVLTYGGNAMGVLVQSIGGGGGLAGSAGSDASADNPVVTGLEGTRAFITAVGEGYVPFTATANLNVGSYNTGSGGYGGTSTATVNGTVQTQGDWAHGVVVQSIGGGGGMSGSATATGSQATMNLNMAIGGGNQASGNGGSATVNLGGATIVTGTSGGASGFSAFGILVQSIGGGGGMAADGSDSASGTINIARGVTVGYDTLTSTGSDSSEGTVSGNGGAITLTGSGSVTTYGIAAHGVVLQSIGGSGGIGGAGSSKSPGGSGSVTVALAGSGSYSSGIGGSVNATGLDLTVNTYGANAFGILAQSIGGGGGLGAVVAPKNANIYANGQNDNYGYWVSVGLNAGSSITTRGTNAYGIFAQSVGGGGGIAAYSNGTGQSLSEFSGGIVNGGGGTITVSIADGASITTTGAGAHGIIAQSVGNGGGVSYQGGELIFGSATDYYSNNGTGGDINIDVEGSVNVSGSGAYGILAQSTNGENIGGPIIMTVGGSVVSAGTAIMVGDGAQNTLTINSGGLVQGATALNNDSRNTLTVYNYGQFSGSVSGTVVAGAGELVVVNNYGRFFAGPDVQANVVNTGFMEIGRMNAAGFNATTITGNLTQTTAGALVIDADFVDRQSDVLTVQGNADLKGTVLPRLNSILSGVELPVMKVNGTVTGDLTVDNSGQNGGSKLFIYDVVRQGNQFNLVATGANFAPAGLDLSENQKSMAGYLGSVFKDNTDPYFGTFFAGLDSLAMAGGGGFSDALNQLSPGASLAFGSRASANSINFGNQVLNGPVFDGETATPTEVQSTWARMYGRTASQKVPGGFSDFTSNNTIWQVGGQWEVEPDWYVGGSLGYQYDWMNSDNGSVSGDGHTALMAVMAKHEMGPWLFSGAITGSAGWLTTERNMNVPGFAGQAHGSPTVQTVGGVLRAAYTFTQEGWYARPMLTTNVIYANSGSYTENGAGPLNLAVRSADQTSFITTPGFEIGARTNFDCGLVLRSYLVGGVSFSTEDSWSQKARFTGAPVTAGDFTTVLPQDDITGRVTAGWQLQTSPRTSVFVQYEGEYSENLIGNGGSFGVKFEF